jgi:hypothetical protein
MECKGCSEKSHLVQEAAKGRDKPLIDKKPTAKPSSTTATATEDFDPSKMSSEEIMAWFNKKKQNEDKQKNELMEKLRAQGFKFGDGSLENIYLFLFLFYCFVKSWLTNSCLVGLQTFNFRATCQISLN